jgi:Mg-chelatase subunit ChlD
MPKLLHGRDASSQEDREAVERAERAAALIEALCGVLETTDRIMISSKTLGVSVKQTPHAYPGWTDGETIFLNERLIQGLFGEEHDVYTAVRIIKGTNYHELAHIMFTPRQGTPFRDQLAEWAGYDYVKLVLYNTLEDQRIETLYTKAFSATRHYFVAAAMQWLIRDLSGAAIALAYPLLRGRRYLPGEVRDKARAAFTRCFPEDLVDQLDNLIDVYIATSPGEDPEKSVRCIAQIYDTLLNTVSPAAGGIPLYKIFDSATKCRVILDKGEIDSGAEGIALAELAREIDGDIGPWNATVRFRFLPGELGRSGGGGPGGGDGLDGLEAAILSLSAEELLEAAREALRDALLSAQITGEVSRTHSALQAAMDRFDAMSQEVVGPFRAQRRPAPSRLIVASNRLAQRLQQIRDELEPVLIHDLPAGRLNIPRVIRHVAQRTSFDIFDRYEAGHEEEAEMEVVILLDVSTSMRPRIDEANAAMWILKRALDSVDVRSTVYGFGVGAYLLYAPHQRVKRKEMLAFPADDGATRPYEAMRMAYRTMRRSGCPNRMLVVITDGRWGGLGAGTSEACDHMIAALREGGTKTVLFTLGGALRAGGHNCEYVYEIDSPEQVVDVVEQIVAGALASAVA